MARARPYKFPIKTIRSLKRNAVSTNALKVRRDLPDRYWPLTCFYQLTMEDAMHRIDLLVSSQSLVRLPHKARLTLLRDVLLPRRQAHQGGRIKRLVPRIKDTAG
jgi:hypothetical protein